MIGGLIVATFVTLTVVPAAFAIAQNKARMESASLDATDPASRYYETQEVHV